MRVLVTGANGFIGSHAAWRLAAAGHEVVATARQAQRDGPASIGLTWSVADLAGDALDALLQGCDAVVHCAARASPWGLREDFLRDNLQATRRLVAAAAAAGSVRRFVFMSSPSIYFDYRDADNITEDHPVPTRWPTAYAESKWLAEQHALAATGIGPIALRPRAVFGAGDRAIVPRILAVARGGYFPLPHDGQARIDITHVDNVIDAIELALAAPPSVTGRAFNVTNGEPTTVRDILRQLFEAMDLRVRMVPVSRSLALASARAVEFLARLRPGAPEPRVTRYGIGLLAYTQTLSIAAARSALGYSPRVSLADGMATLASAKAAS
ncbi:MAG: hypothetical protein RL684_2308 [Pseudomonadota bacterium]|jgi:nucleoside-diphosphate-sugar epimerase